MEPEIRRNRKNGSACSIPGCGGQPESRGWCNKHYQRFYRHGDPLVVLPRGGDRRSKGATMRTAENEIDMEKICDILKEDYKVAAYVEQTGGGCATIMAGEVRDDEGHYQACAGPGWFRGPGWQHGVGDLGDFSVGFDDDGETESIFSQSLGETWNEDDVARILAGIVNGNIEEHATIVGTLPFYPDPSRGAFYTAAGNHVGELVAPMNEDGSMDPEGITEIQFTYEEA